MIQQVTQFTDSELETIAQIWLQSNLDAHDFISAAHWQDNYDFVKKPLPMPLSTPIRWMISPSASSG